MADAATEALAGLRSPDTGERRRAGLNDFIIAFERFNGAVNRVVDIIGEGALIDLPVITVPTTEATTTTTTTPQTTTTATTTTTTPEAETTTTTTTTPEIPPTDTTTSGLITRQGEKNLDDEGRISQTIWVKAHTTKDELSKLAQQLADEYRLVDQYKALRIYFAHFHFAEDTLGWWEDAPHGDRNRAGEVEIGDYSLHQVVDETVEKNWSHLPTSEHVERYRKLREFWEGYNKENNPKLTDPVDSISLAAADLEDYTEADLREANAAWNAWIDT